MYAKLKSGASNYDVIFPSDYMVQRLISEGMLEKLDMNNIPNYENIGDDFKNLYFDPSNDYSIPYTCGVIGIIYDANVIDSEIIESLGWKSLWQEDFSDKILMVNNPRDALGIAMYDLGIDVNTEDKSEWDRALKHLQDQKPLVQAYVMDEVYNKMETGEAAICVYYAGDYFTMVDNQSENVDLSFYQPEITNAFVDCMCIPKGCKNKEAAEIFIDYMLQEEPAIANAEYIYYASPNSVVYNNETYIEDMGEDCMEVLYPSEYKFNESLNLYGYKNLDPELLDYQNTLWETLKIGNKEDYSSTIIVTSSIVAVLLLCFIIHKVKKYRRSKYYND
jgi:spermidine/putrescine transport system substrate-binding protein